MSRTETQKLKHTLYMREYRKRTSYKEMQRKLIKIWKSNNQDARKAHRSVYKALKSGTLIRPSNCSSCSGECVPEGHHTDYSNRLDVTWLCGNCHRAVHKALKEAK